MTAAETLKAYEDATNLHRFDAVAPLIATDAVFWFSDGSHIGLDAIRAAFERTWQLIRDETYWLDEVNWIASGQRSACCLYRYNWKGVVNGTAMQGNGRGTSVLRADTGGWLIVHEHLSRFPKPT
jgi:ketosteroid isomerase-like protein